MSSIDKLINLTKKVFQEESEIIGDDTLFAMCSTIINNQKIEIVKSKYGSNFDLSIILSLIAVSIQIIDFGLKFILKEKNNITKTKLKNHIENKININQISIDEKSLDKILEVLIKSISKNDDIDKL